MGAISIVTTARGKNMQEAFRNACAEAEDEYGRDSYNGQINNCQLIGDWTNKRKNYPEDDHFHEAILNKTDKREVIGYCTQDPITNTNKTKSQVERNPQKGSRKWVTMYEGYSDWENKIFVREYKLEDCIKKARALVDKKEVYRLKIRIIKALKVGESHCATISYKSSSKEREGTYVFVGMAPY